MDNTDPKQKIEELLLIINDNPRDVKTMLRLGELYIKAGKQNDAIKIYEQVANIYEEDELFLKAIAVYKEIQKHSSKTDINIFIKLAKLYEKLALTNDAIMHYNLIANYYEKNNQKEKALETYQYLSKITPENSEAKMALIDLYIKEGYQTEAKKELLDLNKRLKKEKKWQELCWNLEKLVILDVDNLALVRDLIGVYLELDNPQKALYKLKPLYQKYPNDLEILELLYRTFLELSLPEKAEIINGEINKIKNKEKKDNEIIQLDDVLEEQDINEDAIIITPDNEISKIEYKDKKEEENIPADLEGEFYLGDEELLFEEKELQSNDLNSKLKTVDSLINKGELENAMETLKELTKLGAPLEAVSNRINLITEKESQAKGKDFQESTLRKNEPINKTSIQIKKQASEEKSTGEELEKSKLHFDLACAYKDAGMYDDAISEFNLARMEPTIFFDCDLEMARIFYEKKDFKKAIDFYKECTNLDAIPKDKKLLVYYEYAKPLEAAGLYEIAKEYFVKIYNEDKNYPNIKNHVENPNTKNSKKKNESQEFDVRKSKITFV
jgi:tetratricopeptide (TPR) repeat protein